MPSQRVIMYAVIFLAGVMLADKIRSLPGLNKLPTF
jgi:hypothetical protein